MQRAAGQRRVEGKGRGLQHEALALGAVVGGAVGNLIAIIVGLGVLYPSICIAIKRCHDRDKSGWWICILFIPLIGFIWWLVEFGFLQGTVGPNRFGADPLEGELR